MKIATSLISAIIGLYLVSQTPKFILREMREIALTKVDKGLPSMVTFTQKLTNSPKKK